MSTPRKTLSRVRALDLRALLNPANAARSTSRYTTGAIVFAQGDPAGEVIYIEQGRVKLSVLSKKGKEAVVAILGKGDFLGEGCLAGQTRRMGTASAMADSTLLVVAKHQMIRLLHKQPILANQFIAHMLTRNIRIEEDLIDQLFNSSEKRLARTLLLLARYGHEDTPQQALPRLSQETLAEIVGTTRSRVNFFMNKFRRLGFIEYDGCITVKSSLLSVGLHD